MKINVKKTFILMMLYVKNDYELDPDSWTVRDLLGSIHVMPSFKKNINSETSNPAYWTSDPAYLYDWKELTEEELAKDKSILDENNGLTLEQGLVAMQYFFDHKYWVKNNDMLLKDAYEDLVKEYNDNKNNLESSQLWQEWLTAVAEGKKFDKIFEGKI